LITGETRSQQYPNYFDFNCTATGNGEGFISKFAKNGRFISKFAKNGTLTFSTIFGGSDDDLGVEIASYGNNRTVVIGFTESNDMPIHNAHQDTYGGAWDMFLMKLDIIDLDIPTETETPTVVNGLNTIFLALVVIPFSFVIHIKRRRRS